MNRISFTLPPFVNILMSLRRTELSLLLFMYYLFKICEKYLSKSFSSNAFIIPFVNSLSPVVKIISSNPPWLASYDNISARCALNLQWITIFPALKEASILSKSCL